MASKSSTPDANNGRPQVVGAVGSGDGWALVAADDSEFWLSLRRELPELEERLFTVRTGRDCLRAIEDRRTRVVVLDSSLGDVSGTNLVHLVRQLRPDLGIVLTFAISDQAQEREARQAGILYYGDRQGTRDIAQVVRKGMAAAPAGRAGGSAGSLGAVLAANGGTPCANGSLGFNGGAPGGEVTGGGVTGGTAATPEERPEAGSGGGAVRGAAEAASDRDTRVPDGSARAGSGGAWLRHGSATSWDGQERAIPSAPRLRPAWRAR